MRLINVSDQTIEEFQSHEAVPYAILSHTWGKEEVTLQDFYKPEAREMAGWAKIEGSCLRAAEQGLSYLWVDTCCIAKTSSAELSEAINSIYLWYSAAKVCYAYLKDVDWNKDQETTKEQLRSSRWFRRGWTLQELIAPVHVKFFSSDWTELGSRAHLHRLLSKCTGIPSQILLNRPNALTESSIAMKMSWASKRQTTRKEDIAYCLMGLFGVNMPILYGEGDSAFLRLQEEILRISHDHSLFAWTPWARLADVSIGLLAESPLDFSYSSDVGPYPHSQSTSSIRSLPTTMTNLGLHIRLPVGRKFPKNNKFIAQFDCRNIHEDIGPLQLELTQTKLGTFTRSAIGRAEFGTHPAAKFQPQEIYVEQPRLSASLQVLKSPPVRLYLNYSSLNTIGYRKPYLFPPSAYASPGELQIKCRDETHITCFFFKTTRLSKTQHTERTSCFGLTIGWYKAESVWYDFRTFSNLDNAYTIWQSYESTKPRTATRSKSLYVSGYHDMFESTRLFIDISPGLENTSSTVLYVSLKVQHPDSRNILSDDAETIIRPFTVQLHHLQTLNTLQFYPTDLWGFSEENGPSLAKEPGDYRKNIGEVAILKLTSHLETGTFAIPVRWWNENEDVWYDSGCSMFVTIFIEDGKADLKVEKRQQEKKGWPSQLLTPTNMEEKSSPEGLADSLEYSYKCVIDPIDTQSAEYMRLCLVGGNYELEITMQRRDRLDGADRYLLIRKSKFTPNDMEDQMNRNARQEFQIVAE